MGSQVVGEIDSLGQKRLGKLGDEEQPAIKQRKRYRFRDEQIASALAMTDEACREAEMLSLL